jgi:plastocyanin
MHRLFRVAVLMACSALVPAGATAGAIQGKVICRGVRDCAGALVYIERLPGRTFPPAPNAVMDQLNLTFVPAVLPVVAGTKVVFPNSDEVRHNVFSPSPPRRFNLGTYPKGVTKSLVFDRPGIVELLCNVHSEMFAYIVVTETPYVALVAPDGSYALENAPAGTYTVVAWRREAKVQRQQVTLAEGETIMLDFELRR